MGNATSQLTVAQRNGAPNSPNGSVISSPHRIKSLMKDTLSSEEEIKVLINQAADRELEYFQELRQSSQIGDIDKSRIDVI